MFLKSAHVYDLIYGYKDYKGEAEKVRDVIARHAASGGRALLDVGCGTGAHDRFFTADFDLTGIDFDPGMIEVARERVPNAAFVAADMRDFNLNTQFDAVICLFSAIGYAGTVDALNTTLLHFARHTKPGGVVIVEPWFYHGQLSDKYVGTRHVDQSPQLQVVRMSRTTLDGSVSILHFHYLVGTPQGIEEFSEEHRLTMYTQNQYLAAFEMAGLTVTHEMPGLTGRGLYIGTKPRV